MITGAIEISEKDSHNEFRAGGTQYCRIADARAAKESFDGLYSQIKPIVTNADVWDIGGAAGIDWFRTGKKSLSWTVFELAETWSLYHSEMSQPGLHFSAVRPDLGPRAAPPVGVNTVLYMAGSIQYQETPLQFLRTNSTYCNYVVIKEMPHGNKTFLTVQNGCGVSWFFKLSDILDALPDFVLINTIGENTPYQYENHLPPGFEAYNIKNLIFKRK